MSPSSSSSQGRTAAIGLTVSGLLVGVGGGLHPRVDTRLEFDQGLAGMFESSAWISSHALTMVGFAMLAVSLAVLVRTLGSDWSSGLRLVGWLAVAGAGFAAVESVPHLLAESEAAAVRRGDATPLTALHTSLQVISTPAAGLSLAALALAGARSRALDGGLVPTSLAVLGGLAFALAGPAIAISKNPDLSPLFAGAAGLAIWTVVVGLRMARRPRRNTTPVHPADRDRDLAPAGGQSEIGLRS